MPTITLPNKDDLVTFNGIETRPVGLSGMQMKFGGTFFEITGRVAHVRGDHLTEPKSVGIWLVVNDDLKMNPKFDAHWCDKCGRNEVGPIDFRYMVINET